MNSALLTSLRFAGPAVLVVSVWAVWMRRITLGSRFDRTATIAVGIFGLGSALTSPWPVLALFLHPVTGKFYVPMLLADLLFNVGAVLVVQGLYRRLMPDDAIGPFMRRWIIPATVVTSIGMVVCFIASEVTSVMSGDHLYLVAPDGWLNGYWVSHFGTTALLGFVAAYGAFVLRRDPRSVLLTVTMGALLTAAVLGGAVMGWSVISQQAETLRLVLWLMTYQAFVLAAIASVVQWRNRERGLVQPTEGEAQVRRPAPTQVADPDADLSGFAVS